MKSELRPVSIGLILGIIGLLFGIAWAFYITVFHENIHNTLSESRKAAKAAIAGKFVITEPMTGAGAHAAHDEKASAHSHEKGVIHNHAAHAAPPAPSAPAKAESAHLHSASEHEDPEMEEAHERLTRGHLHAMGLGLVTIVASLLLGFLSAPNRAKTAASIFTGIGGLFYPFAWIIMGFRTPALGPDAAHASVVPIAGFSVILVVAGLLITLFFLVRGIFARD